jgi:hypothetical protein
VRSQLNDMFDIRLSLVKRSNGEEVPDEEPLFILRARDRLAVKFLKSYRYICALDGCNGYTLDRVDSCIAMFERFAEDYPERMKQPGVTKGA